MYSDPSSLKQTLTQKCNNLSLGLMLLAEPELLTDSEILIIFDTIPEGEKYTAAMLMKDYYAKRKIVRH